MPSDAEIAPSPLPAALAALLAGVDRHGDFFVTGTVDFMPPALDVDGVGRVAFPLLPAQAEQLLAAAEAAPFGRGPETILDPTVRQCWQIGPERVNIAGRHWPGLLDAIVGRVGEGLAIADPITASFYKLLIYKTGSFFVSHRDTEKSAGMFATLVLVLPGQFEGGEMRLRHGDREVCVELRSDDPAEAAFVAFYADCVHEIRPLTAGYRLALIYNLARAGRGRAPKPPDYSAEQMQAAKLLRDWGEAPPGADWPAKLVYPLAHAYTPAELGFATLKGEDAAAAGVLRAAADAAGCDLSLALLTVTETGSAEYPEHYRSDDDLEAGEVDDRDVRLSDWRHLDVGHAVPGKLPVDETEISPPDAMDDLTPDDEYFHEATGNAGATFERSYQRAALVVWPRARFHAVLVQSGVTAALPHLANLVERWHAAERMAQKPLWDEAHDLAAYIVPAWPQSYSRGYDITKPGEATRFLHLLARLNASELIERFILRVVAVGGVGRADNEAVVAALGCVSAATRVGLIEAVLRGRARSSPGPCAHLLSLTAAAWPGPGLTKAAEVLLAALPGDPARTDPALAWQQRPMPEPALVSDLLNGVVLIDAQLVTRATDYMLAWPATYAMDAVVIPALRSLLAPNAGAVREPIAIDKLRQAGVTHLQARVAEDLTPPKDWRRAATISCKCQFCRELVQFLEEPDTRTWVLRAAEHNRSHVQTSIRQAGCDVDVSTDKSRRPYGLVCVKNQSSFNRRARQRKQDLDDLQIFSG